MTAQTNASDEGQVRRLEAEVRTLTQRVAQRDKLLQALNRRLFQLERGESGMTDVELVRMEVDKTELQRQNANLQEQLDLLLATKIFRWAAPARNLYARLRAPLL